MQRAVLLPLIAAGLLCLATPAWAIPAPLSPADLLTRSDLVVLVRVASVTCIELWRDASSGEFLRTYSADLRILKVRKGAVRRFETVKASWKDIPAGLVGAWSVGYSVGEELWTHLVRGQGPDYHGTWWNARGEVSRAPERTDLPKQVGETIAVADNFGPEPFSLTSAIRRFWPPWRRQ